MFYGFVATFARCRECRIVLWSCGVAMLSARFPYIREVNAWRESIVLSRFYMFGKSDNGCPNGNGDIDKDVLTNLYCYRLMGFSILIKKKKLHQKSNNMLALTLYTIWAINLVKFHRRNQLQRIASRFVFAKKENETSALCHIANCELRAIYAQ